LPTAERGLDGVLGRDIGDSRMLARTLMPSGGSWRGAWPSHHHPAGPEASQPVRLDSR
jgi:hypothetical protein